KFYAIIKYDNEDVVRYVLDEKLSEEQMPTLERFHETFVKKAEAMQKIALIQLDPSGKGGKVIVKDRSKRTNISGYFKGFLNVKRVNSEIELCNKLIDALKITFKRHKELLPESIQKSGVNKIYEVLSRADFEYNPEDASPLLTSIFGPLDEKSPILNTFKTQTKNAGIEGESFTIKADGIHKPPRRKIETAESVVISYNEDDRPEIRNLDDGRKQIIVTTARIITDDIDTSKNR
ncbi:TPA: nucleoid-associated protein, partial [Escherichia coli]|nr:nucleoid-associated protein [Escherichia coli]